MRKYLILSAAGILTFITVSVCANDMGARVVVNDTVLDCDIVMKDDRVYVPLRAVSDYMGADVSWDQAARTASIDFVRADNDVSQMLADVSPSVVAIVGNYNDSGTNTHLETTAHGSGVVIKSGGEILTNAHVVKNLDQIIVVMNDGAGYEAKLKYMDEDIDLAVIKINKLGLKPIRFAEPSAIVAGKTVVAIGTPISFSLRNSASKGIISGVNCSAFSHYRLIQTDAAINPGNSGGPLVNGNGELVGINSAKFVSASIEGMGFAIPVDTVQYALGQFEAYGRVRKIDIGIQYEESWAATLGLPTKEGLTVTGVEAGSAAAAAGIAAGDILMTVGGMDVHGEVDFYEAMKGYNIGDQIPVTIVKNGSEHVISVTAAEKN